MTYNLIPFGRKQTRMLSRPQKQLELAISGDKQRVVISERNWGDGHTNQVGMMRDEVLELMKLLGREFVLDALADISE